MSSIVVIPSAIVIFSSLLFDEKALSPIVLTGDVGYNLLKKLDKDYEFYHELTDAFNYLLKKDYDVIQIIYRSEYARNITYLPN